MKDICRYETKKKKTNDKHKPSLDNSNASTRDNNTHAVCTHTRTHCKAVRRIWALPRRWPPLFGGRDTDSNFTAPHPHFWAILTPPHSPLWTSSHHTPNSISRGWLLPWQLNFPEASSLGLYMINGLSWIQRRMWQAPRCDFHLCIRDTANMPAWSRLHVLTTPTLQRCIFCIKFDQ